jgi:hypothetical protein
MHVPVKHISPASRQSLPTQHSNSAVEHAGVGSIVRDTDTVGALVRGTAVGAIVRDKVGSLVRGIMVGTIVCAAVGSLVRGATVGAGVSD